MKDIKQVTAKVIDTHFYDTSHYGNPRYLVILETNEGEKVQAYTQTNSMLGYAVNNPEFKEYKEWFIGKHYNKTCLEAVQ